MKGVKVKVDDVTVKNNFDMAKFVMKIIATSKNLYLSETELHALTYFVLNGYNAVTKEELISNKLLKNKGALNNLTYGFRKYGIIIKGTMGDVINQDFNIPINDLDVIKMEILIKKQW
jgi:hypothetical protein